MCSTGCIPEVVKALDLRKARPEASARADADRRALSAGGEPLTLHGAYGESARRRDRRPKQAAWKELRAQLFRYAGILKPFLPRRPPDLDGMSLAETLGARP